MDDQRDLSVIVPVYNEDGIVWRMTEELAGNFDRIVGAGRWFFVFVENGSTDRTPEILGDIVARWPSTQVEVLSKPDYGNALRTGFLAQNAPWSHIINIEQWDIVFFEWAWRNRERYDLFLGSKLADPNLNRQSNYRRFLSWGLNSILRWNFDYTGADTHGPKLIRTAALKPVAEQCLMRRGQFDTEMVLRALRLGLWVVEAPTVYVEHRPPRNYMIRKVLFNLWDQIGLYRAVAKLPYASTLRYRRYAREDLESDGGFVEK